MLQILRKGKGRELIQSDEHNNSQWQKTPQPHKVQPQQQRVNPSVSCIPIRSVSRAVLDPNLGVGLGVAQGELEQMAECDLPLCCTQPALECAQRQFVVLNHKK